ncbi:hypothetical protein SprV_0401715800 [Sparganum proliferum]
MSLPKQSSRLSSVVGLPFLEAASIRDFPPPSSKHRLQRFLDIVNFYRQFLPHCADTILSLMSLLSGSKRSFELSADAHAAFDKVKALLANATLLTHFSPDIPISLMVDASNVAVGAFLQQHLTGHTQPLAFFSRKLPPARTRYSTFARELLAVFLAVIHLRHFLERRDFTVSTDHKPLSFPLKSTFDKMSPREIRQLGYSSQFTSDIRHIDGSRKANAIGLRVLYRERYGDMRSRLSPMWSSAQTPGANLRRPGYLYWDKEIPHPTRNSRGGRQC